MTERTVEVPASEVQELYDFFRVLALDPKWKAVRELSGFTTVASIVNRLNAKAH